MAIFQNNSQHFGCNHFENLIKTLIFGNLVKQVEDSLVGLIYLFNVFNKQVVSFKYLLFRLRVNQSRQFSEQKQIELLVHHYFLDLRP